MMADSEDNCSEMEEDMQCANCSDTKENTTSIPLTALDGLVNANSLFSTATFVGLTFASQGQQSLQGNPACVAGTDIFRNLVVFEVVSFSFFIFSSLLATGLKVFIVMRRKNENSVPSCMRGGNSQPQQAEVLMLVTYFKNQQADIPRMRYRVVLLFSALGSAFGCFFLMLSLVNVSQITLGLLSCGSIATGWAVAVLVTLVLLGLVFYIFTVFCAFNH